MGLDPPNGGNTCDWLQVQHTRYRRAVIKTYCHQLDHFAPELRSFPLCRRHQSSFRRAQPSHRRRDAVLYVANLPSSSRISMASPASPPTHAREPQIGGASPDIISVSIQTTTCPYPLVLEGEACRSSCGNSGPLGGGCGGGCGEYERENSFHVTDT